MSSVLEAPISSAARWGGYIVSGLISLFFFLDGVMKLFKPAFVVEATTKLGYQENVIIWLGAVLVFCTILYLVPLTSILGAVLLTGYLGGAVATHVRVEEGAFPVIFAAIFGVLVWVGLYLRDPLVRALLPLRK